MYQQTYMIKLLLFISLLIFLNQCSAPGTALFGPVMTAAKTGSVTQTSLSYGSSKVMNKLLPSSEKKDEKKKKIADKVYKQKPTILLTYHIDQIEISEVQEPEPLP